jgi:hypothetical protein
MAPAYDCGLGRNSRQASTKVWTSVRTRSASLALISTKFQYDDSRFANDLGSMQTRSMLGGPFTDEPVVAGSSVIRAVHITELRGRIDALRIRFGLPVFRWTDETLIPGTATIRAQHITELRMALAKVFARATVTPPTCTDPSLAPSVPVKAVYIEQLRAAVLAL